MPANAPKIGASGAKAPEANPYGCSIRFVKLWYEIATAGGWAAWNAISAATSGSDPGAAPRNVSAAVCPLAEWLPPSTQELLPVGWPHNPTVGRSGSRDLSDFEKRDFEERDFEERGFELPAFARPRSVYETAVVQNSGIVDQNINLPHPLNDLGDKGGNGVRFALTETEASVTVAG